MKGQLAVKGHWNEIFVSMVYKIATLVAVGMWIAISIAADGGGSLLFFKALEEVRSYSPLFQAIMMRIVAIIAWTATGVPFFVAQKIGKLSIQTGYLLFGVGSVIINTVISLLVLGQAPKNSTMLWLGVAAALVTILLASLLKKEREELPEFRKEVGLYILCLVVCAVSISFNFLPGLILSFSLVDVAAMPLQLRAEQKIKEEGIDGLVGKVTEWILLPIFVFIPTSFVFGSIVLASEGYVLSKAIAYANVGSCLASIATGLWLYSEGGLAGLLRSLFTNKKGTLVISLLVAFTATLAIYLTSFAY